MLNDFLLFIEPDREILDSFQRFLTKHSYSVAAASNGEEAARRLFQRRPDLIVIEPVLSENWASRLLDQYQQTAAGVPVIGLSKQEHCDTAFPFRFYYVKPVSLETLLTTIRTTLKSAM